MNPKIQLLSTTLAFLTLAAALPTRATVATNSAPILGLQDLQGRWEGVIVGQESAGKVTISFKGDTLHFQGAKADDWYDATFILREGVLPQQLVATITGCKLKRDLGKVIDAVFKLEDGTLFLAGLDSDGEEQLNVFGDGADSFRIGEVSPNLCLPGAPKAPRGFSGNRQFSYRFQKAQSQAK